jgi:phage tail sheath gpL-like
MPISTAVDPSARASITGIETTFVNLAGGAVFSLPQRIGVFGQGNNGVTYSTTKKQVFSAQAVGEEFGFGSPLHLAVLQLLPVNGDGVGIIPVTLYPLEEGALATAAVGAITPTGTVTAAGEFRIVAGGVRSNAFSVAIGDTVADFITAALTAISGNLNMPITATDGATKIDTASKWHGASADDIVLSVEGPTDVGFSFAFTQPTGGTINPTVDSALAQMGNVWETMLLNCLDKADTTALGAYAAFGDGRWGSLVHKPLVVFTGDTATTVANAIAIPDARKTDRTNGQLVSPGTEDLPFIVAARELARIAAVANSNAARDYGGQQATGLTPGADGDQWDAAEREAAFQGGSSTVEVVDNVVTLSDTITFYHPTGDATPAYRYVKDIVRLQNIIYNLALIFEAPEWKGAPLIPDDQATTNKAAKKPKMAVGAVNSLIDNLGLQAIISDPETAKSRTQAAINENNQNRLDVSITIQLSGNTNIKSITLGFGFYFGTAPVI